MVRTFSMVAVVVAALIFCGTQVVAKDYSQHIDQQKPLVNKSGPFLHKPDRSPATVGWKSGSMIHPDYAPASYPGKNARAAIQPVSWNVYLSVGKHGGQRHYRNGYRHHGRHHYHNGYRVYRKHNFYGPNRNFYDSDRSYSYYEKRYDGDHYYRHGGEGRYRHGGGLYRHHPSRGRDYGIHRY